MNCAFCDAAMPEKANFCPQCGRKNSASTGKTCRHNRSNGEGTITKLSGRTKPYWARTPVDKTTGKRKSLGCYATRSEAAAAIGRAVYGQEEGPQQTFTLGEIYLRFTNSHYFAALSSGVQGTHHTAWKALKSDCENIPVNLVNKETFQRPVDEMRRRGLKRATMAKVRNLASLLCKEAMGLGLISINYGQLVHLPRNDAQPVLPFSSSQLKLIWEKADAYDNTAMATIIMCYTGMRPGELLGVRLEKHLHDEGDHWYFCTGSKTEAGSDRIIPIPTLIRSTVQDLSDGRRSGPLVCAVKGGAERLDNWRTRCFNPLMSALGIEGRVPYSFRHTYADLQKRRQVAPEIMMEVTGHTDFATTVEHYHTTTEEDISRICEAADGLERPQ